MSNPSTSIQQRPDLWGMDQHLYSEQCKQDHSLQLQQKIVFLMLYPYFMEQEHISNPDVVFPERVLNNLSIVFDYMENKENQAFEPVIQPCISCNNADSTEMSEDFKWICDPCMEQLINIECQAYLEKRRAKFEKE